MSVERIKGKIAFNCDGRNCAMGLETDTSDFATAKEQLEDEGWLTEQHKGEYRHYCSNKCSLSDRK